MNATPHTHKLKLEESTGGWTAIRVQYGDQPRHYVYTCWPGWRSRTRRVAKRMVRRHDRHSLKAGRRAKTAETLIQKMGLCERSGAWGRDVLTDSAILSPIEASLIYHQGSRCWALTGPEHTPPIYFSYKAAAMEYAAERGYVVLEHDQTPTPQIGETAK